ncbi:hypothetical protein NPIL_424251 [Nephila pilipes]|uniref:Uncharacterized protein n=1 Tax=Nephila pilipes TaxID=299642 RepID=A0A8X6QP39_NEPPI|nr:hypothetical protein NPIL_424251 [Nephila pilipes]
MVVISHPMFPSTGENYIRGPHWLAFFSLDFNLIYIMRKIVQEDIFPYFIARRGSTCFSEKAHVNNDTFTN